MENEVVDILNKNELIFKEIDCSNTMIISFNGANSWLEKEPIQLNNSCILFFDSKEEYLNIRYDLFKKQCDKLGYEVPSRLKQEMEEANNANP